MISLLLTALYVLCFQLCAWPAIHRIRRRQSSADLSVWREWLILIGVTAQFTVMVQTGASWLVKLSPIASGLNVLILLGHIWYYRPVHPPRTYSLCSTEIPQDDNIGVCGCCIAERQ